MPVDSRSLLIVCSCLLAVSAAGCASQPVNGRSPGSSEAGTDANSHIMVAEIALQRGEYHTAADRVRRGRQLTSDATLSQRATSVAFENGQLTAAAAGARRWLELEPQSVDAHRYLAVTALRLHLLDESLRHFEPVLAAAYATPAAGFLDFSATLSDEDNAYGVLRVTEGLAERHKKVPEAHYAIAVAALRAYTTSWRSRAAARRSSSIRICDAEQLLARALVVNGQNDEGHRARAQACAGVERYELAPRARAAAERGQRGGGGAHRAQRLAGGSRGAPRSPAHARGSRSRRRQIRRCHHALQRAAGRGPLRELVVLLARPDPRAAPRPVARRALLHARHEQDRTRAMPSCAPRACSRALARATRRYELLDTYTADHPESDVDISIGRAQLLAEEGDSESALAILDDIATRYPDSVSLQYARGVTLDRLGQVDGSIETLRALLARSGRGSGGDERTRLYARGAQPRPARGADAGARGTRDDAGQRCRPGQHGMDAAPPGASSAMRSSG